MQTPNTAEMVLYKAVFCYRNKCPNNTYCVLSCEVQNNPLNNNLPEFTFDLLKEKNNPQGSKLLMLLNTTSILSNQIVSICYVNSKCQNDYACLYAVLVRNS